MKHTLDENDMQRIEKIIDDRLRPVVEDMAKLEKRVLELEYRVSELEE